jgi:hypothetical protein
MIGGSKKYEINFEGHHYVITVKRPLPKKLFGKQRHAYLFSFTDNLQDLSIEQSIQEILRFLNPRVEGRRYSVTDENPEFHRNFNLFINELDAVIASHTNSNEDEYITGLVGLLAGLRLEKTAIDAQAAAFEAAMAAEAAKAVAKAKDAKMKKLLSTFQIQPGQKKISRKKLSTIVESIEGGRRRWRSIRRRK